MVKVKFFGVGRLELNNLQLESNATNIKKLLAEIETKQDKYKVKDLKGFLIYINKTSINNLKMYNSKLSDGDEVLFMSPASGG